MLYTTKEKATQVIVAGVKKLTREVNQGGWKVRAMMRTALEKEGVVVSAGHGWIRAVNGVLLAFFFFVGSF